MSITQEAWSTEPEKAGGKATTLEGKISKMADKDKTPERVNEPKYNPFTQQELPACKPLLVPKLVVITFMFIGTLFIPLGAICLQASSTVVEYTKRYDDFCVPGVSNAEKDANMLTANGAGTSCQVTFQVTEKMKKPVFVYYELHNFYQNHRRYVKSRSDEQIRGDATGAMSSCEPKVYTGGEQKLEVSPCGLIAWSFFNDTYTFQKNGQSLAIDEKGIAWKSDRKEKFGSQIANNFNLGSSELSQYRGGGTITGPLNENEHFIVWMRTSALPTFRKLYGKIDEDLEAGTTITVDVDNRYNTYKFSGKKKLVLSTASWLGGKNDFLGIAYLTVGSICFIFGLVFLGLLCKYPRELGDVTLLSWNKVAKE